MNKDQLEGALRHSIKMRDLYKDYWRMAEEHGNEIMAASDKEIYGIWDKAVKAIELELSRVK